jgi:cellobiose phosphorylase
MNDKAEIRKLEPYCHGQFTESVDSPFEGRSHVHWLTGTASTVMVGCVEGILGLRPDFDGLKIDPAVSSDWKEFSMDKDFRGSKLHIVVKNPNGKESGVTKLTLNGQVLESNYIKADLLKAANEVIVEL